jgi:hypothetical protein
MISDFVSQILSPVKKSLYPFAVLKNTAHSIVLIQKEAGEWLPY